MMAIKARWQFEQAATKDLIQTIDRLPCVDKINPGVGIKITGRKISFIGQTEVQPVSVEITEATGKGSDVVIYLNRNIVSKALEFGLFRLQVTDELSPARFSDDAGRQIIVMPVRQDGPPPTAAAATAKTTAAPEPNGNGKAEPNPGTLKLQPQQKGATCREQHQPQPALATVTSPMETKQHSKPQSNKSKQ